VTLLAFLLMAAMQVHDDRPVILAFGDSLTAGYGVAADLSYPSQLQKELDARGYAYRVVNQGVSGSTTVGALGRMTRALALQPHVVIIQFGGNDVQFAIPPNVTRDNLRKIIDRFRAGGTRVILAARNSSLAEFAQEEKVEIVYFMEGVAGNRDLLLSDGVHPTGEGYAIVVQSVLKVLEPIIRQKDPRPE
jgi:acyl-CoA thioesterase-1